MLTTIVILAVLMAAWIVWSWWNWVATDESRVRRVFGALVGRVIRPRPWPVFLPRFWGIDFFRIPTAPIKIKFVAQPKDVLVSKDGKQIPNWEVSIYLILPYIQREWAAINKMARAGIDVTKMSIESVKLLLKSLLEDLIVPALSGVISQMDYDDIECRRNLERLSELATNALRSDQRGVLQLTGIAGSNPADETEGTGSLKMTIEYAYNKIILDEKQRAKASESTAQADYQKIYGAAAIAKQNGFSEKSAERLTLADKGQLSVTQVEIAGVPNLQYFSTGGGGGGGVLFGAKGNKGTPGGQGTPPGGQKSPEVAAQEYFDKFQKWPTWWDPVNKKVI